MSKTAPERTIFYIDLPGFVRVTSKVVYDTLMILGCTFNGRFRFGKCPLIQCVKAEIYKYVPSKYTSTRFNQPWGNRDVRRLPRRKKKAYKKAQIRLDEIQTSTEGCTEYMPKCSQ